MPLVLEGTTVFRSLKQLSLALSICIVEGTRAEKPQGTESKTIPVERTLKVIQITILLALLGKWGPRVAKGPSQCHRSQMLIWEETPEATPCPELPGNAAPACSVGFSFLIQPPDLPGGSGERPSWGLPCSGEELRSAVGLRCK